MVWKNNYLLRIGCIFLVLASLLGVRLYTLYVWETNPSFKRLNLFQGKPLLTTLDGYYYLRYGWELAKGVYNPRDELRYVPQNPPRPSPPPLLSLVSSWFIKFFSLDPLWVASFMPVGGALFIAVVLFLLGRYYVDFWAGLLACLFSFFSPYLLVRTGFGRFDTDFGILFFSLLAIYLGHRFAEGSSPKGKLFWLGAGLLNTLFFMWWWDQVPVVAAGLGLFPLVGGAFMLALSRWGKLKSTLLFLGLGALLSVAAYLVFPESLGQLIQTIMGPFRHITKEASGPFPSVALSISEEAKLSFTTFGRVSYGHWGLLLVALLGWIYFIFSRPKVLFFWAPFVILAGFAYLYAARFILFLVPLLSVGLAVSLISLVRKYNGSFRFPVRRELILLLLVVLFLSIQLRLSAVPAKVKAPIVEGMILAGLNTPKEAIIWSWWDDGYPLMFFARRGTISDGQYHDGELVVINGVPLASPSFRLAANWIHFYLARGRAGLNKVYQTLGSQEEGFLFTKKILAAGPERASTILVNKGLPPEEWLPFFFPPSAERRKAYLFLDQQHAFISYWWYFFGTWNPKLKEGQKSFCILGFGFKKQGELLKGIDSKGTPFLVDLKRKIALVRGKKVPLKGFILRGPREIDHRYLRKNGAYFIYRPKFQMGALVSENFYPSLFTRLFLLGLTDKRYFRPALGKDPIYQLWEVRGDALPAEGKRSNSGL